MQDLIKRYFWLLGGVVVMVAAVFAAKATSHVVEAKFLGDSEHGPKIPPPVVQVDKPVKATRSKDGTQLTQRDMFCSDCTPPVDTTVSSKPGGPEAAVILTTLPLQLLATNVGPSPEQSYASVINTESQHQGAYGLGDQIPGAVGGHVVEIHYKYIEFENSGHLERLVLAGATAPVVAAVEAPPAGDGDELQASIDSGVKKIDDNNYEIDRALVDKILANPMAIAKGARIVPSVKNGKPDGFKLYAIRPSSVYAKLGMTNGDTIQAINGMDLTSADKALEVYTKLKDSSSLEVDVTRRGKPTTLKYTIK